VADLMQKRSFAHAFRSPEKVRFETEQMIQRGQIFEVLGCRR